MPTSDPIEILISHDLWASQQILQACQNLMPEQFHQKFEMGPGSLHNTIEHMIGAMRLWVDVMMGREPRPQIEGGSRSVAELSGLLAETHAEFSSWSKSRNLDEMITRERGGKVYSFTRGAVIVHVTTHGTHHRAQCLNMLRHLGVSPLPPSSVIEWTRMTNG